MWIKREEYERLLEREEMCKALEEETKRLAEQISSQTEDCKVGAWCKDCIHAGYDKSQVMEKYYGFEFVRATAGQVRYCKKHLHKTCPEFEM